MAAVIVFATGPPASIALSPAEPPTGEVLRGAFHIHTTRSDGALDKRQIAAAARRAGLDFAVFTDHGDGTRAPDPPEYMDDVLCVDGVEVSTNGGHYIAVGIGAAPYPLGGDADAVAEDVARLGGFGVAAHPSSRRSELAWADWNVPVDAIEWLNADSEWRDESRPRLVRALLDYLWRSGGAMASLLDRPDMTFARWDEIAQTRRVIALAGHDAHGGFGADANGTTRGKRLHVPSYEASFRTFSLNVHLAQKRSRDAAADAALLMAALREGRSFTVIDPVASPGSLGFEATAGEKTVPAGGVLPVELGAARFAIRTAAPPDSEIVLLRNGVVIARGPAPVLHHRADGGGAFRVEVRTGREPGSPPIPWLVSNPIFRLPMAAAEAPGPPAVVAAIPLMAQAWHTEASPGSDRTVTVYDDGVRFGYRLQEGARASQFAALVTDLSPPPTDFSVVSFRVQAEAPVRASLQLRFAGDKGVRWRKSFYADSVEREVHIPIGRLRPADANSPARPPVSRATSLLFVVDLTNAAPGARGSFTVRDVSLGRLR